MIRLDEDALVCDLAETYHIYDYRALPGRKIATLACGLRSDSRIKMKMAGTNAKPIELLLAAAVDRLSLLVWAKTKDGAKGRGRPKSIVEAVQNPAKKGEEVKGFDSGEDFKNNWNRITGKEG